MWWLPWMRRRDHPRFSRALASVVRPKSLLLVSAMGCPGGAQARSPGLQPGERESKNFPSPGRGDGAARGASPAAGDGPRLVPRPSPSPLRGWDVSGLSTRGRRASGALTPGYVPSPLPGRVCWKRTDIRCTTRAATSPIALDQPMLLQETHRRLRAKGTRRRLRRSGDA